MNVRRILLLTAVISCGIGAPATTLAQDWLYTFRQGDTLWDLCIKYSNKRGCWIELGKYNNIGDDKTIPPGDIIRFPHVWLTTTPVVGKTASVQGDVSYDEKSSGSGVPLVAGQSLLLGSRIVTGQGTARITLGDSSTVLIRPHSELQLDSLSSGPQPAHSAELSLDAGDVDVKVEPDTGSRFQISTPAAIAAVRGTRYRVSSNSENGLSTRSEVLAGAVEVRGVGATLLPAGFGLLAQKGKALGEPRKLPPPPAFQQKRVDAPQPVEVHWEADPGAVSWLLDVQHGQEGGELYATHAVTSPEIVLDGLDEACYRLVLRGIDSEGFNGLESELPLCVINQLAAPADFVVTMPEYRGGPYRVAWAAVPGASEYSLEVAADASFKQLIASKVVKVTEAAIAIPDADRFKMRVTAVDKNANYGMPSNVIEVRPNPVAPLIAVFASLWFLLL